MIVVGGGMIINRIKRAFKLTEDLVRHLDEDRLNSKLGDLPSNTIGQQLWCVIGARESYLKGIENNGWSGFSCSLKNPNDKSDIIVALEATIARMEDLSKENFTEVQEALAFDLLEHEIQHHGQLIRFVYGNKLSFPVSWHDRYTV